MAYNSGTDIRASHTIRIFGTNKNDDILHDIWLDIERVDVYRIFTRVNNVGQDIYRKLRWLDDPNVDDYSEEHPVRTEGTLKICSPDEKDQEDPEEWVPVKTIVEMDWDKTSNYRGMQPVRGNRTSADNENRTVGARRCFHRETTIDEDVDAAIENNPELKAYAVASDKYDFKTEDYDEENYIEVQYVSYTSDKSNSKADSNGKDQDVVTIFKNSHYLNFTKEAEGPVNPSHGFDPPWALDPFQAIVNVNWKTLYLYVRVTAANSRAGKGGPNPISGVSKPTANVEWDEDEKLIKKLDERFDKDGNKDPVTGPSACMQYMPEQTGHVDWGPVDDTGWSPSIDGPLGKSAQASYDAYIRQEPGFVSIFATIDGGCVPRETEYTIAYQGQWGELPDGTPVDREEYYKVSLATTPINYSSSSNVTKEYLFKISAAEELLTIEVSGLLPLSREPPYQDGGGSIAVSVYSTAREKIKELKQLINYDDDEEDKLDPDHTRDITLNKDNQGEFKISVRRSDPDEVEEQTDNYGSKFQPYQVFFEPEKDSKGHIPGQPPKRLPLPSSRKIRTRAKVKT